MQRALTSGVSGMINNQLVMETTANNLANVNTTGFKSSRVSFATALVQTSYSGSAAGSATGGRNPMQTGLGMTSNSVDVDMRQGSIQSTGRSLDLAIQGEGFFEVTDGTTSSFTRVGNFAFDSSDNLVSAGTGFRLIGNTYSTRPNPDGSQSITQIGVPLQIDRSAAFPPKQTEELTFNGNLSPTTRALRGFSLTSAFPMINTLTGKVATEDTKLSELSIFKDVAGNPGDTITMNVFGTKPDGSAYGAQFELHPWDTPTIANNQIGSVSELILKLGNALSQGSDRFGSISLDNGNLLAAGVGNGENFSMFLGEGTSAFGGTNPAIAGLAASPAYTGTPITATTHTVLASEVGLIDPAFVIPAGDFSAQTGATLRIAVSVNGVERGTVTIPAANYLASTLAQRTFHLPSFPHVEAGDVVTVGLSGALNPGSISYTTTGIRDSDPLNKTADVDGDGDADMFEEGSSIDANAWVYENGTNTTFDWYRARVVPETIASSIDVYDAQGGKHTLATRFFRTGTRTDSATGAIYNSWDMMVNAGQGEGTLMNSVVAGIEFDQNGRFTGSVGTSARGTAYTDAGYAGNPGAGSIQIDWSSTGPTDPTSIAMDFGSANGVDGLTGFGGSSTATAVAQDGYPDGRLDTITMSAEGDLMGMYTNGVTLKLAQVQLATFRNPAGLLSSGNSMFVESANSGVATRRNAGEGAGFITAGALEGGNVDIATEFTRIITAQRGFQVNARVIQTTDSLLEELANLIR